MRARGPAYRERRDVTGVLAAPANLVTAGRAILVGAVALIGAGPPTAAAAWAVIVVGTVAAVLDLADGWLARRTGTASAFGARFDMEVDSILVLVLSVLLWRFGVAGPWVLASGLMRYAFVAAAWPLPWLSRPLPPRRRRQAVCVVQIVALLVAMGPILPRWFAQGVAATGLAILTWSFAVDVAWLRRQVR
jgi:phosphatidylglycerophosphate synthase